VDMPRQARKKAVYSTYYIYQEGKDELLFRNDKEKNIFLEVLKKAKSKYAFKLYAFCIQEGFYKLIIFDNGNDITKIMKSINVSFTMRVNNFRSEKGKIFIKRFKSKIIDNGKMLLEFSKNIHLDSRDVKSCHSSYCAYFKNEDENQMIDTDIILKGIVAKDQVKKYQMYVNDEELLEDVVCEYDFYECVNKDQCIDSLEKGQKKLKGILKQKKLKYEEMLLNKKVRNELIRDFRQNSTLSLNDIGHLFGGMSASGICKILNKE
jgi:REP element-mobilizing transposase RayT